MAVTLLERVQRTAAPERPERRPVQNVEDLREAVQRYVPSEVVAALLEEDPFRARNELRSACRQVFAEPAWAAVGAERRDSLTQELVAVVFGMGPLEPLLADESITEITVNKGGAVWVERDGVMRPTEASFASDAQVRGLIDRILGPLGRRIDESSPSVSARLPQGHRVHAVVPPVSPDGPVLAIRKFSRKAFSLPQLVEAGSLEQEAAQFLHWAVASRRSIAVLGGTGSGKTTLLNALSLSIPTEERIITIEDSLELKFSEHPQVVRLEARHQNAEGLGEVTIRSLVVDSLRMRPDRIIVGECRGGEALDMLTAMNTGHDGSLTTLHANSPQECIDRLVTMCRYVVDLPPDVIEAQIGHAFQLMVQTQRHRGGRRFISAIAAVGFCPDTRRCQVLPLYQRLSPSEEGQWLEVPEWVDRLVEEDLATEEEVRQWRRALCR
ncbi:CpaF family protein [Parvibacter caecicola]|uniref:CpaF family protein n=1 Tax=Parvibacter caecicola TaxID=747645 RepID=UPI0023F09EFF|nr:CpaF family protein [Parvibacter caecicola]